MLEKMHSISEGIEANGQESFVTFNYISAELVLLYSFNNHHPDFLIVNC